MKNLIKKIRRNINTLIMILMALGIFYIGAQIHAINVSYTFTLEPSEEGE